MCEHQDAAGSWVAPFGANILTKGANCYFHAKPFKPDTVPVSRSQIALVKRLDKLCEMTNGVVAPIRKGGAGRPFALSHGAISKSSDITAMPLPLVRVESFYCPIGASLDVIWGRILAPTEESVEGTYFPLLMSFL
jgi:hypothetical protein